MVYVSRQGVTQKCFLLVFEVRNNVHCRVFSIELSTKNMCIVAIFFSR